MCLLPIYHFVSLHIVLFLERTFILSPWHASGRIESDHAEWPDILVIHYVPELEPVMLPSFACKPPYIEGENLKPGFLWDLVQDFCKVSCRCIHRLVVVVDILQKS